MDPRVHIQQEDFNVADSYAELRDQAGADAGAIVTFVGLVRDRNSVAGDGSEVNTLTLEHYPGMTENSIVAIFAGAASPCERRDCEHPSSRRDPTGRTGAGMPELRRFEILQSILLSKSLHFESKRCSCEGWP